MSGVVRSPIFESHPTWPGRWLGALRGATAGIRLSALTVPRSLLLASLVVVGAGVLEGAVPGVKLLAPVSVTAGQVAEAGDLLLQVDSIGWLTFDGVIGEGLAMAAALQPGLSGSRQNRLHLEFTVRNTGLESRHFRPQEFWLRSERGGPKGATGSSFTAVTLAPQQTLAGALDFDVDNTDSALELVWTRDCCEVRIPIGPRAPDFTRGDRGGLGRGRDDHGRDEVNPEP